MSGCVLICRALRFNSSKRAFEIVLEVFCVSANDFKGWARGFFRAKVLRGISWDDWNSIDSFENCPFDGVPFGVKDRIGGRSGEPSTGGLLPLFLISDGLNGDAVLFPGIRAEV